MGTKFKNHVASITHCHVSGKQSFSTRRVAKAYARLHQLRGLNAFKCGHCEHWHLGHLPKAVKLGKASRESLEVKTPLGRNT